MRQDPKYDWKIACDLGQCHEGDRKYCRRCEIYLFHPGAFRPCYGMAQRVIQTGRKDKDYACKGVMS